MIARPVICVTAFLAFSGTLHAQNCAGGMDATGNECNAAALTVEYSPGPATDIQPIQEIGAARHGDQPATVLSAAKAPQPASDSALARQMRPEEAADPASFSQQDSDSAALLLD